MSPSRTGPLTLRMMDRLGSSMNSTRTCVTLPVLPVRPGPWSPWRVSLLDPGEVRLERTGATMGR